MAATELACLQIAIAQAGRVLIEKTMADCTVDDDGATLHLKLTQADTLAFADGAGAKPAEVQLRGILADGTTAVASPIYTFHIGRILREGEISCG